MTKGGDYAERSRTNVHHLTSSQSVTVQKLSMAPGLLRWAPVEEDPGTPRPDPLPGRDGAITAWAGPGPPNRPRSQPPAWRLPARRSATTDLNRPRRLGQSRRPPAEASTAKAEIS